MRNGLIPTLGSIHSLTSLTLSHFDIWTDEEVDEFETHIAAIPRHLTQLCHLGLWNVTEFSLGNDDLIDDHVPTFHAHP